MAQRLNKYLLCKFLTYYSKSDLNAYLVVHFDSCIIYSIFPLIFGTVMYEICLKQRKIKFKARIKLNHNTYNACKTLTNFPLIQILFSPDAGIIKKIPQEVHFNLLSQ